MPNLPSHFVTDYLNRRLDDLHQYKTLGEDDIAKFCTGAPFVTEPYAHQRTCFAIGRSLNRFLLFLHPGTGKTKIALDIIQQRNQDGRLAKRVLVLVPSPANIGAWAEEVGVHQPSMSYAQLGLDRKIPGAKVVGCTYARLTRLMCDGKKRWKINFDRIAKFAAHFDAVVFDESTKIKNLKSLITVIAKELSWHAEFAVALTGTPFGRDPTDIFAQFLVVDGGETFGKNLPMFHAAFFKANPDFWRRVDWVLNPAREGDMRRIMRHRSIRYSLEECLTLPRKTEIEVPVELSPDARIYYDSMANDINEDDDKQVSFVRLCQVATGFAVEEDDDGERVVIDFDNPKMDALMDLLEQIPTESKVLLFVWFTKSGNRVCELLDKRKIGYSKLFGGMGDAGLESVAQFKSDESKRVLVLNPQSGGYGLNLQIANYAIFYESPVSPIVREQAVDRIHRGGQDKPVFIYDIYAARTVERKILTMVREGKDLLEAVLSGRVKFGDVTDG